MIDTATSIETVVVRAGDRTRDIIKPLDCSHSVTLFSSIDTCFRELGIGIGDIDLIGVGTGPGSFTGIRIAVSTARMLAQVLKKPLVGVMTTTIYAISIPCEPGDNILVAFDAKKKRVFGALYTKTVDMIPAEIVPPGDYPIEHLLDNLRPGFKTAAAGDGIEKYYQKICGMKDSIEFLRDFRPNGELISRYITETYCANPLKFGDINTIVPFYSRKSDAEVALEEKNKK